MTFRRWTYSLTLLLLASVCGFAQNAEKQDSLVRLLSCDELQQTEIGGHNFRKAFGHARFEHNSTLLLCDTALWNVNSNVINGYGNVRIIQNETVLSSDKLTYLVDEDLAKFRGAVVQLLDKQGNTLRTRNLDYNTKDSVATFFSGGSMRDKDGQIIESDDGTYDSKIKIFTFKRNVNMYTDSIFVKTDDLVYNSETTVAVFGDNTNAWKENNMLSAHAGWYNRSTETFLFNRKAHVLTDNQEAWADTMKFYRIPNDVEMFGNVELLDTTRNAAAVAGWVYYRDSTSTITMARDPAVIFVTEDKEKRDTAYIGADTLVLWTMRMCDISEPVLADARKRLDEINVDPITAYRKKAAEEARAAAEEAKKKMLENDPNAFGAVDKGAVGTEKEQEAEETSGSKVSSSGKKLSTPNLPSPYEDTGPLFLPEYSFSRQAPDSLRQSRDSLVMQSRDSLSKADSASVMKRDSVSVMKPEQLDSIRIADSLASIPPDTTKINFALGIRNVRVFRSDMQVACDSLAYTDLDSLVRLYKDPIIWNEIKRQYSADSVFVVVKNQNLDRASLMSNAFIIVEEDPVSYDQIRGTEMMAYFDTTGTLKRFDAMGGASGIFYIEEQDALATVNKFEAKMFTATFTDGEIDEITYFDDVKSDAYPAAQMKKEERLLKGYNWQPDKRPDGPSAVTEYVPRESERTRYEAIPQARFDQTEIYFPGYMASVHEMLEKQDSLKRVRQAERRRRDAERKAAQDSLAAVQDSLNASAGLDSLATGIPTLDESSVDSEPTMPSDSLAAAKDSPGTQLDSLQTPSDSLGKSASAGFAIDAAEIERAKQRAAQAQAKAAKKAAAEEKRLQKQQKIEAKQAAKEARWAYLDSLDNIKAEKKAAKALEKKRAETLKTLQAVDKRTAKEQKLLEKYKASYEKQKARKEKSVKVKKKSKDKDPADKEPEGKESTESTESADESEASTEASSSET